MADQRFTDAMAALQAIADDVGVMVRGGKSYTMVKDRIEIFRQQFGDEFGIDTHVEYTDFNQGDPVVGIAKITDRTGRVIASGYAVEFVGSTKITAASPIEVAETSAIGRALACFGLAGSEYASAYEMEAHDRKEDFRGQHDDNQRDPAPLHTLHGDVPPPVDERDYVNGEDQAGFYIPPADPDAIYLQPDLIVNNVIAQVDQIETTADLGKYWNSLKEFAAFLKQEEQLDTIAEIKAAFATRHNALSGGN